jgi:hypothetical protein
MGAPARRDWVVVLASKEDLRTDAVARALAGLRKAAVLDAMPAARRSRGIVLENATLADAEALVRRLEDQGLAAKAGYAEALSTVPPAILLANATTASDGLRAGFRGGEERLVPWARIRILALGTWTETVRVGTKEVEDAPSPWDGAATIGATIVGAAVGVPIHITPRRRTRKVEVTRTETLRVLDLLLRGPEERLRIRTDDFDWSGLGPRMAPTSFDNLRALVEEVLRFAPDAGTSPGADLLRSGGRLSSVGHDSPEDFEREERWLLSVLPG